MSIAGKWLEVLKEVAPGVNRSIVILNPDNPGQGGFQGTIETAASSLWVQISPIVLRDGSMPERVAMERAVEAFARQANGGMIVLPDFATISLRLDPGGTTMPRITALHVLRSTMKTVSAPAASADPVGVNSNKILPRNSVPRISGRYFGESIGRPNKGNLFVQIFG